MLALFGGPRAVPTPYTEPWPIVTDEEVTAVVDLMRARELSSPTGSGVIKDFEGAFARYLGVPHALVQNSGTSALHAAYWAVGVGPGDEVIVPTYTWPTTATAAVLANAIPVFCDIDRKTLTISPEDIRRKITPRTKAIAVVHMWGHPGEMDEILSIAREHSLAVIEDASHAHGATYRGRRVGTFGDVACFSLQASKMVIGGEAGIAVTQNPTYFDRMLVLGHMGGRIELDAITGTYAPYAHTGFGPKYRAHPLAVAIANVQLRHLDEWIGSRRKNLDYLTAGLAGLPGIEPPYTAPHVTRGAWYGYRVLFDPAALGGMSLERFIAALRAEGVDASPERYWLLHAEPLFQGADLYERTCGYRWPFARWSRSAPRPGDFPVAEEVFPRLFALPTFTAPCKEVLDQYAAAFRKVTARHAELVKT
jgi:dTDP-4-amino-4,6-dideoxygalactose transaminase